MARPKLLGSLLLLYVLLAHWWDVVGELLVGLPRLANVYDAVSLFLLGVAFLEVLFRLSYVIGGIGLIRSRIWAPRLCSSLLAWNWPLLCHYSFSP